MEKPFLPEGYKVPKTGGGYFKLQDGANKFRILSAPILGHEYWTEDRKPVRSRELFKFIPTDADISNGFKPKHFWAFVVWNYAESAVQILELTQTTIQSALTDLIQSDDWGDPRGYDVTVNRKGSKLDTEYTVQPSPHKELPADIKAAFEAKPINLEALFDGANPFGEADGPARSDEEVAAGEGAL